MALRRDQQWSTDGEVYSEPQVEAILREAGIDIVGETERDFLCHCPFHYNTGSPAFSVSKTTGQYICFNAVCASKGNLTTLLRERSDLTDFQAKMVIAKAKTEIDYVSLIERAQHDFEFEEYPEDQLFDYAANLYEGSAGEYMFSRGFKKETLDFFDIGSYTDDEGAEYVTVPMHTDAGMCVGYVGRSVEGKDFKNSPGLPKRMSSWNIHRAKRHGGVGIVCEASFDAMRIHQAGFPNVVALLGGGNLNEMVVQQLQRYFTTLIVMTDNDEAGRKLGQKIEERVRRRTLWAVHGDGLVFPHGAKDAGDMTDQEIGNCLRNAVSGLEYHEFYDIMD